MISNDYLIKDINLASQGRHKIEKAFENMPVMHVINDRMQYQQVFAGLKIAVCSHITKETAVLCITLKNAGARVMLVPVNPRSTHDDIAAALVYDYAISVYGYQEQTLEEWTSFREKVFEFEPDLLLDDAAEVLPLIYEKCPQLAHKLIGSTEQTSSGVKKVKNIEQAGLLNNPVIAVNSSKIKHLFDNHFGVGQTSTMAILQITNVLISAETVVVIGYGPVGKGIAYDMRGLGSHVIVCEINPVRALEAYLDGYQVMSIEEAADKGTVFVTATGSCDVIPLEMISKMKEGAILSNCGSGQVEFDYASLKQNAVSCEQIKPHLERITLPNGRHVNVLTEGRSTNLVGGEGNPATIMDLSFAAISLAAEYLVNNKLDNQVHVMPEEVDKNISFIKLNEFEIKLSKPTPRQITYDKEWI